MKKTLHVTISNKVATYQQRGGSIVCGNEDYEIKFIFDPEWEAYENKVARFKWNGAYKDVPFSGTLCDVPKIKNATKVKVGVYVEDGPYTSTSASIPCVKSVLCENLPGQPEQAQEYRDEAAAHADRAEAAAEAVHADYTETNERVSRNAERITRAEKRITNLEQGITPDPFVTDSSVAYSKTVPTNALPYAAVQMVGGMSQVGADPQTIIDAKVTAIKSVGVNLIPYPYQTESGMTSNGITWTVNSDGSVTANGTATGNSYFNFAVSDAGIEIKENCVLSGCPADGSAYKYELQVWAGAGQSVYSDFGKAVAVPAGTVYRQMYAVVRSGVVATNLTFKPMLNAGSTALPYTPCRAPISFPIPEAVQALDGYGRGIDESVYNYIDFERRQFVKADAVKTFNGSETWVLVSGSGVTPYFYHVLGAYGMVVTKAVLCEAYKTVTISSSSIEEGIYVTNSSAYNGAILYVRDARFATAAEWKAHLAANPLTVYYGLATPVVTDISDLLSEDNLIAVEGGGSVVLENEHGLPVPSEIVYQLKEVTA